MADLKNLVSSGDRISSSSIRIGLASAGVFAGRRICIELNPRGDKVVPTKKTHAFLKALPDKHYGSFKTVLLCEKPRDGGVALDFEYIANRATSYHAMQIRGKVSVHEDGTGSHGRALNTVVHGGTREFRRQGGRGHGRIRRGNGGRAANGNTSSVNSNNSNGGFNSNGTSYGGNRAGNAQDARRRGRGNQASGRGRGPGPGYWPKPQGAMQVLS